MGGPGSGVALSSSWQRFVIIIRGFVGPCESTCDFTFSLGTKYGPPTPFQYTHVEGRHEQVPQTTHDHLLVAKLTVVMTKPFFGWTRFYWEGCRAKGQGVTSGVC